MWLHNVVVVLARGWPRVGGRFSTSSILRVALSLAALWAWTGWAYSASLVVLVPVRQGDEIVSKVGAAGAAMPILQAAPDSTLRQALLKESVRGTVAFALKLDEQAQRAAGQAVQPTWLMLTDEEGGFAKRGFWLRESGGDRFVDQPYVALVVDARSVADGSFEEIFSHELGHVLLRRLIPRLPAGMSRVRHGSLTMTDDPTAFDEGFAIHFQPLARMLTVNAALKAHDAGLGDKAFTSLWQSNVDGTLRIDGVRRNWFIHRQLLPPGDDDAGARRANSSAFDIGTLKNGNQMMASEGVAATVFYRALAPQPSVERYASFFRALKRLNAQDLQPDSHLLPLLAQNWIAIDPQQGGRFANILVETTYGATIEPALPRATVALAQVGRIGRQEVFVEQLKSVRAQMGALTERAAREPATLLAALGPGLWLATSESLVLNVNTAEADQFSALDSSLADWAGKIVAEREAQGSYGSLSDLTQRVGLPAALAARLSDMTATALALGTYARP
jgi:DNA uptake protein ComE-like DNA-binding protein